MFCLERTSTICYSGTNTEALPQSKHDVRGSMLYISIRLAVVLATALAIGGMVVWGDYSAQSQSRTVEQSTTAVTPSSPSIPALGGEMPSTDRDRQRLTLGAGEGLEGALQKTVRQMDSTLTHGQVDDAVRTLIATIRAEVPDVNINTLKPGVSMVILRRKTANSEAAWDVYLGKHSGIVREEG